MWAACTIVFILLYIVADPAKLALPPLTPESVIHQFAVAHGLTGPLYAQYARYLLHLFHGNLGESIRLGEPALTAVLHAIPVTALLVVSAIVVGTSIGMVAGVYSSLRPNSVIDTVTRTGCYLSLSAPQFVVAIMLILLLAVKWRLFPTQGYAFSLRNVVLPVASLSLIPFAHVAQIVRETMEEESSKEYVYTATAKGQSRWRVAIRHQLKNVTPLVVNLVLFDMGRLFVGDALIIEVVFGWPGIGSLAANAMEQGDIYVVQAVVLVAALVISTLNLSADLIHYWIDPRVRRASMS